MMQKDQFYLQLYATSPAPKRDYHGLTITSEYITLNSWDISHGPHVYPRRRRVSLANLSADKAFCSEIQALFGSHVVEYAKRVASGDASLHRVPEKVFRRMVKYLAVGDVVRLGQTSKIFFELCNTNAIWKIIFQKKLDRPPSQTELDVSTTMSWRHMLQRRIHDKRETKKICENFKQGVENLCRQTSKEAEKIRKNSRVSNTLIIEREPPEDTFKSKKISIHTFKISEENSKKINGNKNEGVGKSDRKVLKNDNKVPTNISVSQKVIKNAFDKPNKSTSSLVNRKTVDTTENKVNNDLKPKSTTQFYRKNDPSKIKTTNLKSTKSAKELQNLKSKSVFL